MSCLCHEDTAELTASLVAVLTPSGQVTRLKLAAYTAVARTLFRKASLSIVIEQDSQKIVKLR